MIGGLERTWPLLSFSLFLAALGRTAKTVIEGGKKVQGLRGTAAPPAKPTTEGALPPQPKTNGSGEQRPPAKTDFF